MAEVTDISALESGIDYLVYKLYGLTAFIDALRKIGLERIPKVGIEHGNGFNLARRPAAHLMKDMLLSIL